MKRLLKNLVFGVLLAATALCGGAFGQQQQPMPAQTLNGNIGYLPMFQYYINGFPVYGPSKLQDTGSQLLYNGQPIGNGSSLPAAVAAGLVPCSTAIGTTYAACNPPGSTFYSYPEIWEFGDSITLGIGVAGPPYTNGYGPMMIADYGGNGVDYAVSGASSSDESDVMLSTYNPQYSHNPAITSMIGTNDLGGFGDNPSLFTPIVAGMMEWATVPRNAKVFMTDPQCASTGTWTNVTTYGFPGGTEQSTTPGSTFTCTITTYGPALYFGYMNSTAWTASSMTVLIDGVAPSTGATLSGGMFYGFLRGYGYLGVRYPLAPGTHTFKVTNAGSSGTTGTVTPVWLGSAYPISAVSPPVIYWADIPYQQNNVDASPIADFNAGLQSVITQLRGDGLPIIHVQENQPSTGFVGGGPNGVGWLNYTSDFNAANLQGGVVCLASTAPGDHPNNCGHAHLRDAFEYYIQPVQIPITTLQPTVTIAGSAQNLDNLDVSSSYNTPAQGPTHLRLYTGFGNGGYTALYSSNQFGGNYALMFDPAFGGEGPLTSVPYFGLSFGAANWNQAQNGMDCEATATNAVLCSGGTGGPNFNAAFTFSLYGGSVFNSGLFGSSILYSAAGTALPTCAVGTKGQRAAVSDATTPTYMGAYTSGGAITAEVICSYNGTTYAWLTF